MAMPDITLFTGILPSEDDPATFPARAEGALGWIVRHQMPQTKQAVEWINASLAGTSTIVDSVSGLIAGTTKAGDADKLDGQHGAFYQNAGNLSAGTIPAARIAPHFARGAGYQRLASGLLIQWGAATLPPIGAYNPQNIGGTTVYTHYYLINYAQAFNGWPFSVVASLALTDFGQQVPMGDKSVSVHRGGNGSPSTRFLVALSSSTLGFQPTVEFMAIGV